MGGLIKERCRDMENIIRTGIVTRVDEKTGMVSVTYPDMDDDTTGLFPVLSLTDEYKMPRVGDEVAVAHLSGNQTEGVVLGKYWYSGNMPASPGKDISRKELAHEAGKAFLQGNDSGAVQLFGNDALLLRSAGEVVLISGSTLLTVAGLREELDDLERRVSRLERGA